MPEGSSLAPQAVSAPPIRRARRPGRRLLAAGVAALALSAVVGAVAIHFSSPGLSGAATPDKAAATLTVTVVPVALHRMTDTLMVTGTLVPWEDLSIGTEAAGLAVTQVLVQEGDQVAAGQLLAKLDDSILVAQVKQKQAQIVHDKAMLGEQDANIADTEATAHNAENDVKRAHELIKSANISVQTSEQREAVAAGALAHVQAARMARQVAEADIALSEAQLAEMQARLAQTEIRAPTAGIVSKRWVRVGRVVSPADQLFQIIRDGILELDAEVPDRFLARVQPGQQVRLSAVGADGEPIVATVRTIAPTVDKDTRNGIIHTRMPSDAKLKPGMFVSGAVMLAESEQLAVPESAVLSKEGTALVFVVGEDGRVTQHKIETGLRSEGLVAVRSGLSLTDRVVQSGAGFLTDGDLVKIVDAAAS
jgi:HlyD family secretion protein